jgi:hypothetical protein
VYDEKGMNILILSVFLSTLNLVISQCPMGFLGRRDPPNPHARNERRDTAQVKRSVNWNPYYTNTMTPTDWNNLLNDIGVLIKGMHHIN